MCLAVPVLIVELLENEEAIVDMGGVRKKISTALLDGVAVGEYVIVHVGYALSRIDPEEAKKTLRLMQKGAVNDSLSEFESAA
ncbi:MAG: HypC/HybG/HupF family hydrogenase formation chaperone [Candidatus Moraniibacteriota bacterium]|nr:MAG: HypC/HybG/HupF family hydrogenase formation chaperone [Candidatus Moranbacteria bacterium]